MKQLTIVKISYIQDYILEIKFSDGCAKQFDFSELISFKGIAEPLKRIDFFKRVSIINHGKSFAWDNGYDCCADWARYFAKDLNKEWEGIDEQTSLEQRIKLARKRMQQSGNLIVA